MIVFIVFIVFFLKPFFNRITNSTFHKKEKGQEVQKSASSRIRLWWKTKIRLFYFLKTIFVVAWFCFECIFYVRFWKMMYFLNMFHNIATSRFTSSTPVFHKKEKVRKYKNQLVPEHRSLRLVYSWVSTIFKIGLEYKTMKILVFVSCCGFGVCASVWAWIF